MKINYLVIGLSLLLNSFLLIYLFGLLPFLLFCSALLNVFAVSYVFFLVNEKKVIQEDFSDLITKNEDFTEHLMNIYELEMFYGDETLEGLIQHSKRLIDSYYNYYEKYFSSEPEEETLNQEDDLNDLETTAGE